MAQNPTDPAVLLDLLPFVRSFGIEVISYGFGEVVVEMPYDEAYSTPPGIFPASMVGTLGDVAAVSACRTTLPDGWAVATLDYTIKMTGIARGDRLRARGSVLQAGKTTSVGQASISAIGDGKESPCGTLLATARNFQLSGK